MAVVISLAMLINRAVIIKENEERRKDDEEPRKTQGIPGH